jgi:pilus assembly protein CpaF
MTVTPQALREAPPATELLKPALKTALLASLDAAALAHAPPQLVIERLNAALGELLPRLRLSLTPQDQASLARELHDDIAGFGPLERLLAQAEVSEIMLNGLNACYVERSGRLEREAHPFADLEAFRAVCQRMAGRAGRRVDQANPVCDARLPDGSRVSIVLPPIAPDGPVLTIRRFPQRSLALGDLTASGSIRRRAAAFLELAVAARANILITGGASAGKTTLLNCLSAFAPAHERIITAEDVAELRLQQPHVVRLETRTVNSEQAGQVTMSDLVRAALRMRPDRIIAGEVRGAEAADMIHAMSTGHDGSMGTLHANGPGAALQRLEALASEGRAPAAALTALIGQAIDLIIHMARLPDGRRCVLEIAEVAPREGRPPRLKRLYHATAQPEPSMPARLVRKADALGLGRGLRRVFLTRQLGRCRT